MWFRNIFDTKSGAEERKAGPSSGTAAGLSSKALRQLNRLRLDTGPLLPGLAVGTRPSQHRRPSAEFRAHRQYTPGDDIRYVDWKASARQEHIFVKEGEHPKDAAVYILLDCSASMAWGEPPKSLAALSLAMALGYLALAQGDRLVVYPLAGSRPGRTLHSLGPVRGKGQMPLLIQYLQSVRFGGQVDLAGFMAGLSRRKVSRGGLVLAISDLLGMGELDRGLAALPLPTWNVVVCHLLHPAEINPHLNGPFEMHDIETGQKKNYTVTSKDLETYARRLQSWQGQIAQTCQERKAVYTMLPTDWSLESEIIPHLQGMQVLKPL